MGEYDCPKCGKAMDKQMEIEQENKSVYCCLNKECAVGYVHIFKE